MPEPVIKYSRAHPNMFFEYEKHSLVVPANSYRDKAYFGIRYEAKLFAGAPSLICSRKDMLE